MKIIRINHLGIASKAPEDFLTFFQLILGLNHEGSEVVEEQKVKVNFLKCENSRLELLEPSTQDGPISKFLDSRGSGIHHIALEVDNVEEWVDYLKKKQIRLIDETPRIGAHHTKIVFIHPKATGGILVELVEEKK